MAGKTNEFEFGINGVCVARKDLVYILSVYTPLAEKNRPHTFLWRWDGKEWDYSFIQSVCVSVCCWPGNDKEVFTLSQDGQLHISSGATYRSEHVGVGADTVRNRGPATNMAVIGQHLYVVGMGRQAYRRTVSGVWECIDQKIFTDDANKPIRGFRSVGGFSEQEIYAAGYQGEIWTFQKGKWKKADSPTNVRLNSVCCESNRGLVYVAGQSGMFLRGRQSKWDSIKNPEIEEDIWSIESFQNHIYAAVSGDIYVLQDQGLDRVRTRLPKETTHRRLHANDGVLWSAGDEDVSMTDGERWQKIDISSWKKKVESQKW